MLTRSHAHANKLREQQLALKQTRFHLASTAAVARACLSPCAVTEIDFECFFKPREQRVQLEQLEQPEEAEDTKAAKHSKVGCVGAVGKA